MNLMKFLRKNMNKMLWVLVVLIAAAFGISYTMMEVFQSWWGASPAGRVFGRAVYANEFFDTRKKLERERGRGQEVSEDEVWERIALLEEARRCSIEVSEQELSEAIVDDHRRRKLLDEILTTAKDPEERKKRINEIFWGPEHIMRQRLESIPFDENEYARLVAKYVECPVGEYEELMRERLIINRLRFFVRSSAKTTTKRLYEEFVRTEHKRQIEYVAIHSKTFKDKVEVSDEQLRKYYEDNKKRYIERDKIAFEYIMARFDEFENGIPDPKEEELKEYYEKWRHTYFRRPEVEIPQPPKPEDVYKPYDEVRVEVIRRFLDDKAKEAARKTLQDLKAELDKEQGLPFEMVREIAKKFNLEAKETEPFELKEFLPKFKTEFGRCDEVITMFSRKDEIPELSIGGYSEPVECEHGLFLYRPSKLVGERVLAFEEVEEEVKAAFIGKEAAKLAEKEAQEVAEEIREQEEVTRPILLKHNLYSVVTDFFPGIRRGGKIPSIKDYYLVVKCSFEQLKEIGEVSKPVEVQSMGDYIYYVVKYLAREDPTTEEFKEKRPGLAYNARSSESYRFSEEWEKDLTQRANITLTRERRQPIPSPPLEEEE